MRDMAVSLYHAGGGLTKDHTNVYVRRDADYRINIHLRKMNYSLIIAPRQQGKTSLINNLANQSIHPNMVFVYIDLSTVNRATEQAWYQSFCPRILRQVQACLPDAKQISIPTNGSDWREFLANFAMLLTEKDYRSAIILDEIGAATFPGIRDFFGALRDVYSSRQFESHFNQLTFVLVGSFDPRDLIKDDAVSPFNIAQDIPLPDFTYVQVQELVKKGHWPKDLAESMSRRIYYWTSGQPYLTQKLCSILENDSSLDVDQSVKKLRCEDGNHLKPILNKLQNHIDLQQYLNKILAGEKLKYYPNEFLLQAQLHLMGLIKSDEDEHCIIRNNIYKQILAGNKTDEEQSDAPLIDSRELLPVTTNPTENVQDFIGDDKHSRSYHGVIRRKLVSYFSIDELRTMCFDLGIQYEDFPVTLGGMSRELIASCERSGRISQLIEECRQQRPGVMWEES